MHKTKLGFDQLIKQLSQIAINNDRDFYINFSISIPRKDDQNDAESNNE